MTLVYMLILDAMDISTYLSPMETNMPPMIEGSTLEVRFSVSPFFRKLARAASTSLVPAASRGLRREDHQYLIL